MLSSDASSPSDAAFSGGEAAKESSPGSCHSREVGRRRLCNGVRGDNGLACEWAVGKSTRRDGESGEAGLLPLAFGDDAMQGGSGTAMRSGLAAGGRGGGSGDPGSSPKLESRRRRRTMFLIRTARGALCDTGMSSMLRPLAGRGLSGPTSRGIPTGLAGAGLRTMSGLPERPLPGFACVPGGVRRVAGRREDARLLPRLPVPDLVDRALASLAGPGSKISTLRSRGPAMGTAYAELVSEALSSPGSEGMCGSGALDPESSDAAPGTPCPAGPRPGSSCCDTPGACSVGLERGLWRDRPLCGLALRRASRSDPEEADAELGPRSGSDRSKSPTNSCIALAAGPHSPAARGAWGC